MVGSGEAPYLPEAECQAELLSPSVERRDRDSVGVRCVRAAREVEDCARETQTPAAPCQVGSHPDADVERIVVVVESGNACVLIEVAEANEVVGLVEYREYRYSGLSNDSMASASPLYMEYGPP